MTAPMFQTDAEWIDSLFPNLRVSPPDERLAKMAEGAARVSAAIDAERALKHSITFLRRSGGQVTSRLAGDDSGTQ